MPDQNRERLIAALNELSREASTWTILFHQAIADHVGLNITDHKALDILTHRGAMTAGELSKITGLTTGAITGVIDRLERAGYARRERDPHDRRRVVIQPLPEQAAQTLGPLFEHFQKRLIPLLESYSEDELRVLLQYYRQAVQALQEEIAWLRAQEPEKFGWPGER